MLTKDLLVLYAKNKQISRKIYSTEKKKTKDLHKPLCHLQLTFCFHLETVCLSTSVSRLPVPVYVAETETLSLDCFVKVPLDSC